MMTNEGPAAVEEALKALEAHARRPTKALDWEDGMWFGSFDHCADCGPKGVMGHTGTDGSSPFDRMDRYGSWLSTAGENIAYGPNDPIEIVMGLFIDDGVPGRGHRTNILKPDFGVTAVSTCCHSYYSNQAVIAYAGGYR
jgi:uncharacterized protein YkwD